MTRDQIHGFYLALTAYLWWGLSPLYFKVVSAADPQEVLSHRVIWSVVLLAVILSLRGKWPQVKETFSSPKIWGWLLLSALLVSTNWLIFIWSISVDRLVESSLGYYINPLVNVLLGVLVLKEKLRLLQGAAVALAAVAVAFLAFQGGQFPWIALTLAFTFGIYGLIRKRLPVGAQDGLFVETVMLAPVAIGFLVWSSVRGEAAFLSISWDLDLLLFLAGAVTTLPLVCFAAAARRLNYSTIGMIQYVSPTVNLLIAVFLFGEIFTWVHAVTFGLIWLAVLLYSSQSLMEMKRIRKQVAL
ncbi:EamA family transporter RarD [Kiloniella laminariae]|uniref:EamA family transporter RarD n=1 Tax=Kiloniella laminariae TaxID=454162 RepID=A0ABT4LIE5_9PROT|nr:EamA family transporter RarD [Kiloniella laminariae]MCZ4280871.1 EamA family transporter RarD [Kiloniella laminariae]